MKVSLVAIHFKDGVSTLAGYPSVSFTEGTAYKDLHYIVRDGMAIVNYKNPLGERAALAYPIHDIKQVNTVA